MDKMRLIIKTAIECHGTPFGVARLFDFKDRLLKPHYLEIAFGGDSHISLENIGKMFLRKADFMVHLRNAQIVGLSGHLLHRECDARIEGEASAEPGHQKRLGNLKAPFDVPGFEKAFPQKREIVAPDEIGINYAIRNFIHREGEKRGGATLFEDDYHHLGICARGNRDRFGADARRPNVVACLNFL